MVLTALGLLAVGVVVTDRVAAMTQGRWETLARGATDLALLGSLAAGVVCAWLAWRLVPVLVRAPWTAVFLNLSCLMLPLLWGHSHEGMGRAIALDSVWNANHSDWVPGYWALLLLPPVMARLAEGMRVTGRARYALGLLALLWLAGSMLLLQPDLALTLILTGGVLASACLARPRGGLRWLMVVGLALVGWWLALVVDARIIQPWGLDFDPLRRTYLEETWDTADWQGTGRIVTKPSELGPINRSLFMVDSGLHSELRWPLSRDYVLNATAQLFGWSTALVTIALAALHVWALFRLAGRISGDERRCWRWTAGLYAGVPAGMLALSTITATGWLGSPFSALAYPYLAVVFPWVGGVSDFNSLYVLAGLTGAVVALSGGRVAELAPAAEPGEALGLAARVIAFDAGLSRRVHRGCSAVACRLRQWRQRVWGA